jgi:hypothetical protein
VVERETLTMDKEKLQELANVFAKVYAKKHQTPPIGASSHAQIY